MTTYTRVSADEAMNARKDATNDAGILFKAPGASPEITKASSWNKDDRSARFVMSAEVQDRMGDVVVQEGINIDDFMRNPIALAFHASRSWPIGTWKDIEKILGGRPKRTEGTMKLLSEGQEPDADRAARHIASGTMRAVSIGFSADWEQVEAIRDDNNRFVGYRFNSTALHECSLVTVPAMQLALMKDTGLPALAAEYREMVEEVLDTWAKDPRSGLVVRRETLEAQHRELNGNPTVITIGANWTKEQAQDFATKMEAIVREHPDHLEIASKDSGIIDALPAGHSIQKNADGTITERDAAGVAVLAAEDKPDMPKDWTGALGAVREAARESQEPGLFAKLLTRLKLMGEEPPIERSEPSAPETPPEPAPISAEEKAALEERITQRIAATKARTEIPA